MSSRLQQLNLRYEPEQDRLVFRLRTAADEETRLWFTRKFVKLLWPALLKVLQLSPEVTAQADPAARQAVMAFQHDKALAEADFDRPYREVTPAPSPPAGPESGTAGPSVPAAAPVPVAEPPTLLVNGLRVRMPSPERPELVFLTAERKEVKVALNLDLLHSLCQLLQTAVGAADWDIALEMAKGAEAAPEKLN